LGTALSLLGRPDAGTLLGPHAAALFATALVHGLGLGGGGGGGGSTATEVGSPGPAAALPALAGSSRAAADLLYRLLHDLTTPPDMRAASSAVVAAAVAPKLAFGHPLSPLQQDIGLRSFRMLVSQLAR
jgi:hypothetical protein